MGVVVDVKGGVEFATDFDSGVFDESAGTLLG